MPRNTQKIIVEIKKEYYNYLKANFGYYGGIRSAVNKAIKIFIQNRKNDKLEKENDE